jgi:hypothetical protein
MSLRGSAYVSRILIPRSESLASTVFAMGEILRVTWISGSPFPKDVSGTNTAS